MLCDVLDMSACHVLLGRPWQYDRKTTHDGFTIIYTVRHEGKLNDLIPLPPYKTIPPPTMKPVHLVSRKVSEKEVKNIAAAYLLSTKEVSKSSPIPSKLHR